MYESERKRLWDSDIHEQLDNVYWRRGAVIEETGEKTLTLRDFEAKYLNTFHDFANEYQPINIWNVKTYRKLCINSRDRTGCIDKKMSAVVEMIQFGRQLEYFYAISNFSKSIIHTLKNSIIVTIVFGNTTTYFGKRQRKRKTNVF